MRGFVGLMVTLVILVATAVAIAQPPGPGPDDYVAVGRRGRPGDQNDGV